MAIDRFKDDVQALERINSAIDKQTIIQWMNDEDVDYYNFSDLDMYIYYIKNANLEDEE